MPDRVRHCPFLNRSDDRCASHFSLDHLSDALEQCFDAYAGCVVYRELLAERQHRRAEQPGQRDARSAGAPAPYPVAPAGPHWHGGPSNPHGSPIVQLTLSASAISRQYAAAYATGH